MCFFSLGNAAELGILTSSLSGERGRWLRAVEWQAHQRTLRFCFRPAVAEAARGGSLGGMGSTRGCFPDHPCWLPTATVCLYFPAEAADPPFCYAEQPPPRTATTSTGAEAEGTGEADQGHEAGTVEQEVFNEQVAVLAEQINEVVPWFDSKDPVVSAKC